METATVIIASNTGRSIAIAAVVIVPHLNLGVKVSIANIKDYRSIAGGVIFKSGKDMREHLITVETTPGDNIVDYVRIGKKSIISNSPKHYCTVCTVMCNVIDMLLESPYF